MASTRGQRGKIKLIIALLMVAVYYQMPEGSILGNIIGILGGLGAGFNFMEALFGDALERKYGTGQ